MGERVYGINLGEPFASRATAGPVRGAPRSCRCRVSCLGMAISKDLLGADEHVVLHLRTHVKRLLGPAAALILLGAATGVATALFPPEWVPLAYYIEAGVVAILALWLVIVPFLNWYTTTYTITDRRIITRTGILNKRGHDLPLRRINNVNYEHSVVDRMLRCGTLVFETAAGRPLVLDDVPRVERVHVAITELLFDEGPDTDRGELGE